MTTNLVLTRRPQESIVADGPCKFTVVRIKGKQVTLAIEAERSVTIARAELLDEPQEPTE